MVAREVLSRGWSVSCNCFFTIEEVCEGVLFLDSNFAVHSCMCHIIVDILRRHHLRLTVQNRIEDIIGVFLPISREEGHHVARIGRLCKLLLATFVHLLRLG